MKNYKPVTLSGQEGDEGSEAIMFYPVCIKVEKVRARLLERVHNTVLRARGCVQFIIRYPGIYFIFPLLLADLSNHLDEPWYPGIIPVCIIKKYPSASKQAVGLWRSCSYNTDPAHSIIHNIRSVRPQRASSTPLLLASHRHPKSDDWR